MRPNSAEPLRIGILGAGTIGTFLGGCLSAAGYDVILVGRMRVLGPISAKGIVIEDGVGGRRTAKPRVAATIDAMADRDVVLITTKVSGLERAARSLAGHCSLVVGLQNGVDHPRILLASLGAERARAGTVSFNVVWRDERTLLRGTTGSVIIECPRSDQRTARIIDALRSAGLDARGAYPITPVLFTKLLFNLNNAVNALSNLSLADELGMLPWRRVLAACQREALAVMSAVRIRPVRLGMLDPRISSRALLLPDFLFRAAARSMVRIDPFARSSMADDLAQGRLTEVDALNGVIVRLGMEHSVPTPVNMRVVNAVHALERGEPSPSPETLLYG